MSEGKMGHDGFPYPVLESLVRLRADPNKVRVGIRKQSDGRYYVRITSRISGSDSYVMCSGRNPNHALREALGRAEDAEIPGIDLGCDWSYVHPQQHKR